MISIQLPPAADVQTTILSFAILEKELVRDIQNRCEPKFKQLYQMYAPALMGIISKIVKTEVASEDALQETFIKIWNSIDGFDASRGRLFTWMAATARHTAIDQLRSRAQINANKNSDIDDFSFELESTYRVSYNTDTIGVKQLTCSLPSSEKELLELIYFQGYTHSEAAQKLDMPLGTVKTKLRRAIMALREHF